jgi:AraC-like DNA-binding protein
VLRGEARGHFELQHRPAGPGVADIVDGYWIVEWAVPPGEEREQNVVTRPCVHLTVEPDQDRVTGVVTRCFRQVLAGEGRAVGVRFRPAGFSALYAGPLTRLTDQALPATAVVDEGDGDRIAAELAAVRAAGEVDDAVALIERFVERHRGPRPGGAELVDEAVDHIEAHAGVTRVAEVAGHFGVSARTLQRRFERYLGVGPKWVIQRRRIHDALDEIEHGRDLDWSVLAVRLGFADQAHFVNAFTDIVGQPPSDYERTPARPDAENGTGWPSR